jgi:hypothetical protein
MTSFAVPFLCVYCAHRIESTTDDLWPCCKAYPDGVPSEIVDNDWDHRKPQPGDNGIQFLPYSESADVAARKVYAILDGKE